MPNPTVSLSRQLALSQLADRYRELRNQTTALCANLEPEDYACQPIWQVSPPKWHLGHTTWFFEALVLEAFLADYHCFNPHFPYSFNSYYNSLGERVQQAERGHYTRPTTREVLAYRNQVDEALLEWLHTAQTIPEEAEKRIRIGLAHEEQHQELLLMDMQRILFQAPYYPALYPQAPPSSPPAPELAFCQVEAGLYEIGYQPHPERSYEFSYDNETPRHQVYLHDCQVANRPVTNGEYLAFMDDGGYQRHELWLSDGWAWRKETGVEHPLYWTPAEAGWMQFGLWGLQPLDLNAPVAHISYYEAVAFAKWRGCRLPTEAEWETAAQLHPAAGPDNLLDGAPKPLGMLAQPGPQHWLGSTWEWTSSAYGPYPGYQPYTGALGEYNGKFMVGQQVLRGGCWATPAEHIRVSYRNFYHPFQRWLVGGLRLAR